MHNGSDQFPFHCEACEEMRRLVDLFPGLVIKLVSLATLSTLTTSANLFLIYIACRAKSLVSNTKIFFISLCVSHLLGSVIVIPLWIYTRLNTAVAMDSPYFCQIAAFVLVLMILGSFYSLSALSLDRYFIISDPMRYPLLATTPRKLLVLAILWIFCMLFAAAPVVGWGEYVFEPDAIPICGLNMKQSFSFTIVFILLGHCVPLLVDIFCCGRIIAIARRQSLSIESRKNSSGSTSSIASSVSTTSSTVINPIVKLSKLKQKLNSLRLVFAGTGSFLVCWLPYLGAHIWMTTIRNIGHDEESMPYILEFIVLCIALLNGLINPIVLMISNKDYRRSIKTILIKFRLFKAKEHTSEDSHDLDSDDQQHRRIVQHKNMTEVFQGIDIPPAFVTKEMPFQHKVQVTIEANSTESLYDNVEVKNVDSCAKTNEGLIVNVRECGRLRSGSSFEAVYEDKEIVSSDACAVTNINIRECRRLLSRASCGSISSVDSSDDCGLSRISTCTRAERGSYSEVLGPIMR